MSNNFKKIKDEQGNEHDVHVSECSMCYKESYLPKEIFLKTKEIFPVIVANLEKKNYCMDCAKELEKRGISVFSKEDLDEFKRVYDKLVHNKEV